MNSFIKNLEKGIVKEQDLNSLLEKYSSGNSLMFCVYTTGFCCTKSHVIEDTAHILEVRLFDGNGEFKAVRINIGNDLVWRYIDDNYISGECKIDEDEIQYLDAADNSELIYTSIGGGKYEMPDIRYDRVVIRHYGECNDNGMYVLKDFRIVKLMKEGEKSG